MSDEATLILKRAQDKLVTLITSENSSPGLVTSSTGAEIATYNINLTTNWEDSEVLKSKDEETVIYCQ
ncbi:hypothetical protein [Candidatus Williamhamiltonella defendens]|uniref:hypothetical protein n=1 Tax=Candidatus Williamhamiltonella defendens TaxID=138072 RepID=UPI00130EEF8D|nr:hypothetical protein [Candidatus Hamiltonella defensa]